MTNPNNPVNPIDITYPDGTREICAGLTKLEYFAAQAMAGFISKGMLFSEDVAAASVAYAKALITELNKEDGTD